MSIWILTACMANGEGSQTAPGALAPPDQADLQALAERLMLDSPPEDVRFERYVTPDEWAPVLVRCLTEQGIGAEVGPGGGIEFGDIPAEQAQTQREALYRCYVRFPSDPRFEQPLDENQIRLVYDYQTGDLTACLEGEGYSIPPPPSVETFIESYHDPEAEHWSAYPVDDPRLNDPDEWYRLNEVCPQLPPNEELFGSD